MRQIYYSIRTLLRERGTNIIRIISLSLGLTIGILLFSQIAFELSYEHCYPEPERLAIARCLTTNLSTGETMGDDGNNYDYTLFDVVASTLAQDMPEEIEFASCVLIVVQVGLSLQENPVNGRTNVLLMSRATSINTGFAIGVVVWRAKPHIRIGNMR